MASVPVQWAGRQSGGCQREAGQAGSRLWKKTSHRAILDDSIAKSARPRKKKDWVAAQTPEKKKIWLACPSGTAASSQAAQLGNLAAVCQEAGNRTLTNVRSMRLVRHQPSDRQASRQSPQALPDSQLTLVAIFSVAFDAKPRNNI